MDVFRWGVVGSGAIATAMTNTLREMPDAEVAGVASPTPGRAAAFAQEHNIANHHQSVASLAESGIDVAYIGSSNHRHRSDAAVLLEAGIPVLCEKPLTTSLLEAERLVSVARAQGVFLMEAMWMRFMPFWGRLVSLIEDGAIGPIHMIRADFGIAANADPQRRWFDPLQGGGALLDVGIYPVSLALGLAGEPRSIKAAGTRASTGVDAQVGMLFEHDGGAISVLDCSFVADTPIRATVSGPNGRIALCPPFNRSSRLQLWRGGIMTDAYDVGYPGSGYQFEVEEVHRCLKAGVTDSPVRPLADTLGVLGVIDRVRGRAFG